MKQDRIIITGDLYMPGQVSDLGPANSIDSSLVELFKAADLNICNLEGPICEPDKRHEIIKTGPHLNNGLSTLSFLSFMNANLLTLANNHIFDYGENGLKETLAHCKENNFETVGAGMNLSLAKKIYYKKLKNNTIAIINIAENEWSTASEESAGANPLDIIENSYSIKEARGHADKVILIVHGGHERYPLPSPRIVKLYRYFVDQGADAVVAHHAHCYSGYEIYKDAPIFYGLGNFLFPKNNADGSWNEGFVLQLKLDDNREISFELHPYFQFKNSFRIDLMGQADLQNFHRSIEEYNSIIADPASLLGHWDEYLNAIMKYNLTIFSLINFFQHKKIISGLKKLGLASFFLPKNYIKRILNYIRCESHHDATIQILTKYLNK